MGEGAAESGGGVMKDAIALAKRGLRVMPVHGLKWNRDVLGCTCGKKDCKSVGKHPIFIRWQKLGMETLPTIETWFTHYKDANLGVITGKESGVVVLDIDPKNDGYASLKKAEEQYEDLPDTPTVQTGSGGRHYYFKHPGGTLTNRAGVLGGGIDLRGDGGFVVAPHSRHVSGSQYEWEVSYSDLPFADMPQWLLRELQAPTAKAGASASVQQTGAGVLVREGGRDAWLISIAGTMRRRGLSYRPICAALHYANLDQCEPPLAREDIRRIAQSVCRYPAGGLNG